MKTLEHSQSGQRFFSLEILNIKNQPPKLPIDLFNSFKKKKSPFQPILLLYPSKIHLHFKFQRAQPFTVNFVIESEYNRKNKCGDVHADNFWLMPMGLASSVVSGYPSKHCSLFTDTGRVRNETRITNIL